MAINYFAGLGQDVYGKTQAAFDRGRDMALQQRRQSALNALGANPQDGSAMNALMSVDPQSAVQMQRVQQAERQFEQEQARGAALGNAMAQMPGLPGPARELAASGDAAGAQQILDLYAKADERQRAGMKETYGFLATASQQLKGIPDIGQRVQQGRAWAAQRGLDPNSVTPESVTDAALDVAVTESIGLVKQMDFADKAMGRDIQMRGQDIQVRGQNMTAETAAAGRAVTMRGQNMARENAMIAAGSAKPPAGYQWNAQGALEGIPGGPADPRKMKLTGEQAKSAGQLALARQAEKTLGQFTGVPSEAALAAYGMPVLERTVDAPTRRVLGAQMAFTEAALRFSTGAAYTETEIKNNIRMYFPRPGDTREAINDKAALRQQMLQAMELGAGPAAARVRTQPTTPAKAGAAGGRSQPPAAKGSVPVYDINGRRVG